MAGAPVLYDKKLFDEMTSQQYEDILKMISISERLNSCNHIFLRTSPVRINSLRKASNTSSVISSSSIVSSHDEDIDYLSKDRIGIGLVIFILFFLKY